MLESHHGVIVDQGPAPRPPDPTHPEATLTPSCPFASLALALALSGSVFAGMSLSLPPSREVDLDALLSRAVSLHEGGDFQGAAAAYEQYLQLVPGAARVRSNLGAVWAHLGRYDEAIEQYRRALAQGEESLAIRYNLALALSKAGRMPEAVVEAAQVVEAQPANRDARLLLASCHLQTGANEKVVELLTPVSSEDDKAAAHLLGMALLAQNKVAEAQAVLDRVFRGDSPEGHVVLAAMHVERKDYAKALAELDLARAANPKLPLMNSLYGECLMQQTFDWAGAASAFRRELEVDPNHFMSNLLLGNLLREEGNHEEALAYLTRAAKLRGDALVVKFSLGAVYVALGRTDEARPLLEEVAAAVPGHLPTHMQLAILYHRLGRTADAARERAAVARLQKESEASSFRGVTEAVTDLLRKSAPAEPTPKVKEP